VLKNKSRIAFKTSYTVKKPFQNQTPSNNLNKFGHDLTIPKWRVKMPTNPFMVTKIRSHHLMAIESS
jgi:hypothetical protein